MTSSRAILLAVAAVSSVAAGRPALSEPLIWGIQAEQLEYRFADEEALAWDLDAVVGSDELKLRALSEGEYALDAEALEVFDNQLTLETPISTFFDVKAGIRYEAPKGPDRVSAILGLHGLAPQWVEVDLDFFLSEDGDPSIQLDTEYEALITNRLILVPSLEVDLPLSDAEEFGVGAFGPTLEVGARLSYDLIGRMVSPYVGVGYERAFGDTADLLEDEGEDKGQVYGVVGARLLF